MLTACLPTIHPLYRAKDLIRFIQVETDWQLEEDAKSFVWSFIPNPGAGEDDDYKNLYQITIRSVTDTIEYAGGFIQLGEETYLDMYLPNFETQKPFAKNHLYPVHSIWKVELDENTLLIFPFNSKWMRDLIENNQVRIKHEKTEQGLLITASTDELQQFVKKYGTDSRAFDIPKKLTKKAL